jgi:hypothetical protein
MRSKGRRKTNQFNHRLQAPHKLVSTCCANQDLHEKKEKRKSLLVKGRPFTMERNAKMSWFIKKGVCNCS